MLMTNHVNYVFIHQELVIPRCSSGSPHRAVQASVGADAGTHILHVIIFIYQTIYKDDNQVAQVSKSKKQQISC